jgi:hypothetical protein
LPALAVAENARLFGGLHSAMAEANSLVAQLMESHRLAMSTVQVASQQWARWYDAKMVLDAASEAMRIEELNAHFLQLKCLFM